MNIQIITSSYPAFEGDSGGTAGLFVQSFAHELAAQGHAVVVQPVARKESYATHPGVTIEPIPWGGGDQELASMNIWNPWNWLIFVKFFLNGQKNTRDIHRKYQIERTLCMWVIPCGLFGYWMHQKYDVWALGSDIWKIRKIPFFGKYWIKKVVQRANGVFADGLKLADDVKSISHKDCQFLPSSRKLPTPENNCMPLEPANICHLLFVGRFHKNKGPDLLLKSLAKLSDTTQSKIQVHMFGAGPMEHELKTLHRKLELERFVRFNGPINAQEYSNYLQQVSFFLIPSRIESIPLVFSDAIQSGTPIIAMPVGDLGHLIQSSECGIVADNISAESFSTAIEEALKAGKEKFHQGVDKAYENFKIRNTATHWVNGTVGHVV